jgi:hypothetical protein
LPTSAARGALVQNFPQPERCQSVRRADFLEKTPDFSPFAAETPRFEVAKKSAVIS